MSCFVLRLYVRANNALRTRYPFETGEDTMKRFWISAACLLVGLMFMSFSPINKIANGQTIPPIVTVGQPPDSWCDGSVPWVIDSSFTLPQQDPCNSNATYDVDLNGVKHVSLTWNEVVDLTKNGSIASSIWRLPQPTQIGEAPSGWCKGAVPWVLNGNFFLPNQDPCDANAKYDVHIEGVQHRNVPFTEVLFLTQNGKVKSSIWRLPYPATLPVGSPDVGWDNGSTAWVLDGNFQLPQEDPATGHADYLVTIEGVNHTVDSWVQVIELTKDGAVKSSIWRINITHVVLLPLITR